MSLPTLTRPDKDTNAATGTMYTTEEKKQETATPSATPNGKHSAEQPKHLPETGNGEIESRSLKMVPQRPGKGRIVFAFLFLLAVAVCVLVFVPWQQSVVGNGRVGVYSAMARPQKIEALISGRLERWFIEEGQPVKQGDLIAEIVDIDSKFLDPERLKRIDDQFRAQTTRRKEAVERASRIEQQIKELEVSRGAQIPAAGERLKQARDREKIARQALRASEQSFRVAQEVAIKRAEQRALQAKDRVRQAEQALKAADEAAKTEKLRRDRIVRLFEQELRSGQEAELAELALVQRQTDLKRAEDAVEIAKRDARVTALEQSQADIELERIQTEVNRAREAVAIAMKDVSVAGFEQARVGADTGANVNAAYSNLQSVKESIATIDDTLAKLANERQNLIGRVEQQQVRAPRSGRVVRLATVGAGETVKSGDILATIAPETTDQAVEMTLNGFDAPLVSVGRHVRIQFNGWPALQVSGFPSVAVGTFAGTVVNMDAIDDGTGRIRVWVKPDEEAVRTKGDQPWPSAQVLRPGTEAVCWVMLDTVPLGYELWRQFNGFPPSVKRDPTDYGKEDKGDAGSVGKGDKEKAKDGTIKRPKVE